MQARPILGASQPSEVKHCPCPLPCPALPLQTSEEWDVKKRRARALPKDMLEELKGAARCCEPGMAYPLQ